MISIQLSGGLGNQMFQYACGRALAYRNQTELVFDLTYLENKLPGITVRSYSLDIFNIIGREASLADLKKTKPLIYKIANTLSFIVRNKGIQSPSFFIEQKFSYDARIEKITSNCFLSGYWQSPLYFKSVESLIRQEFTFPCMLSKENSIILKMIKNFNSISLHVRRTDYVNNVNHDIHGVCSIDYYMKAVSVISANVNYPVFFIFSDDIEWVKQNLKISFKCVFVSGNTGSNSYIDMQLMSFCKHNIIANSSFSWWGAWLNCNINKIVIAPQKWFEDKNINSQTSDLIPDTWIRI